MLTEFKFEFKDIKRSFSQFVDFNCRDIFKKLQNEVPEVYRQMLHLDTGGSPKKRKISAAETDRRVQLRGILVVTRIVRN